MKLIFVNIVLFVFPAFASFDCQSIAPEKPGYRLLIVEKIGEPLSMSIQYRGHEIYKKSVRKESASNHLSYQSLLFTNKNKAPASLYLSLYARGNRILGTFHESSYLPVVPMLELSCVLIR